LIGPTADGGFQSKGYEALTMLNGNQTELARKEANLIDGIERCYQTSHGRAAHMTIPLSPCIKMPSPPITRKRSIDSLAWR
jgi:hypothetical protein